jgi:hypothetical protein
MTTFDKKRTTLAFLTAVLILALAALACSVDLGDDDEMSLEQTRVSLQLTQIALESGNGADPGQGGQENNGSGETAPPTAEPTITPTITLEPTDAPDVMYEGISFSYDPAIASGITPATIQGQNLGEDFMPGETYPTHYEFNFVNYAVANHFHTPRILVYPIAEYRAISQPAADTITNLQNTLANRPSAGVNTWLPFLPMWNAGQVFTAQSNYFHFINGSGVRYLTMFAQAIYPVDNENLFYTYQGMTSDGKYYLSAVLPITHPTLPAQGEDIIGNWEDFYNGWDTYLLNTVRELGEQPASSYIPSLELLDQMMASFKIER